MLSTGVRELSGNSDTANLAILPPSYYYDSSPLLASWIAVSPSQRWMWVMCGARQRAAGVAPLVAPAFGWWRA